MQLYKEYTLTNGETIVFDGISMYDNEYGMPIDIYTSKQYHGIWNKKGKYTTNIYFLDNQPSELDVIK